MGERVYEAHVGVALARPPRLDEWRKVLVVAGSARDASLLACQVAACTSVMPVTVRVWEVA